MKKVTYSCDKCGCDFERKSYVSIMVYGDEYDYCNECFPLFLKIFNNFNEAGRQININSPVMMEAGKNNKE